MIRKADKKDIPQLIRLLKQVHKIHSEGRPDYFKSGGIKYKEDELAELLSDSSRPVFVYENDKGTVTGYIFCIHEITEESTSLYHRHTLYIDDLCVDSEFRGSGIGTALYEYAVNYARETGCSSVTLRVWSFNSEALSFYKKSGMKPMYTEMEQIL